MATTTKSSKAKTKTAKSKTSAAKTTTKTSTAKTKSKAVASKTVKKPTTTKAVKTKSTTTSVQLTALQKIYAASIAVYVAIAGAAYVLMNKASYQLSLGYWAKDELASVNGTQFAPATQGVFDIQVRWIVIAIAVLSLVMPVLYLTRLKSYHAKALKDKVLPTRWIEMAVIVGIMMETVAILSGVLDIGTLKLVSGLMVVAMLLGWMAERRTAEAGRPATAKYYLSMVTGLLPWLLIALYAVSTYVYGELRSPWYVYALYAVMLLGASIIGKHQLGSMKAVGKLKDYNEVEKKFATLTLVTRTAFAVVLIVGLMAK